LPAIPSYELAGVVEEAGPGVAGVAPGDEVFALTPFDRDGVAADFAIVPAEALAARPRSLSRAESAAVPMPAHRSLSGDRHGEAHPDDHAFASASRDRLVRLDQRLHGGVCALRSKTALKRDAR
jgi:NADPH:quinone reductase-like Zn-dependent oxidoreductase